MTHSDELDRADDAAALRVALVSSRFRKAYADTDVILRTLARDIEEKIPERVEGVVQSILLARIADQVRSAWILRIRGYDLPAWGILATLWEVSATSGFIAFDPQRARRWIEWTDLRHSPWTIRNLIDGAVVNAVGRTSERKSRDWYTWYSAWCLGKHANPQIQKQAYRVLSPEGRVLATDPDVHPKAAPLTAIDLYAGLQTTVISLTPLARHSPSSVENECERALIEFAELLRQLAAEVFGKESDDDAPVS